MSKKNVNRERQGKTGEHKGERKELKQIWTKGSDLIAAIFVNYNSRIQKENWVKSGKRRKYYGPSYLMWRKRIIASYYVRKEGNIKLGIQEVRLLMVQILQTNSKIRTLPRECHSRLCSAWTYLMICDREMVAHFQMLCLLF